MFETDTDLFLKLDAYTLSIHVIHWTGLYCSPVKKQQQQDVDVA